MYSFQNWKMHKLHSKPNGVHLHFRVRILLADLYIYVHEFYAIYIFEYCIFCNTAAKERERGIHEISCLSYYQQAQILNLFHSISIYNTICIFYTTIYKFIYVVCIRDTYIDMHGAFVIQNGIHNPYVHVYSIPFCHIYIMYTMHICTYHIY